MGGGGALVPFTGTIVSIGVTLDTNVTPKPHVGIVTKKVNRALLRIRLIRQCTTETLRRRLVEALVIPHLDYCFVVYLDAPHKLRTRLQWHTPLIESNWVGYGLICEGCILPCSLSIKILCMGESTYLVALFRRYQPMRLKRGEFQELSILRVNSGLKRD